MTVGRSEQLPDVDVVEEFCVCMVRTVGVGFSPGVPGVSAVVSPQTIETLRGFRFVVSIICENNKENRKIC